jgi:hypothetical protein
MKIFSLNLNIYNNIMETLNKIGVFIVLLLLGTLYRRYMDKEEKELDLRDLYLINSELLEKSEKPILWIMVPQEYNARNWLSFYSRGTTNLNIPYMYYTIKSIIENCSGSFTVCIVDDNSFEQLLPKWTPELEKIGDPLRSKIRYLGMIRLLHRFGGLMVPPSFLTLKNLDRLYDENIKSPFVCENINYYGENRYAPDANFMGAQKNCPVLEEFIDYLARMISNDYTAESIFLNDISKWCNLRICEGKMTLVDASLIGVKNVDGEAMIPEVLLKQAPLNLSTEKYGILIPHSQIEKRTALKWFCYLTNDELKHMDIELAAYFQ